ncbi:MAG TPA: hypothetical protein VJP79_05670, partial [Nitrososphaera sp.]|nr:hypothetical protein [Nitrososphaera sp.]
MKRQEKNAPAEEESEDLPAEKWLVAFQNPDSKKHPAGHVFVRQFYAQGYYEAYDAVMTHAENMGLEVLWFREKRSCEPFLNRNFPELESVCTYCNRRFNHSDPIPCSVEGCPAQ